MENSHQGGVPVMGFFSLDRSMVLAILGQTLTYMIIMLEFKNEDVLDGSMVENMTNGDRVL